MTQSSGTNTRSIGAQGEFVAEQFLLQKGLILIDRNFSSRNGEIDLIMQDGNCLVFVEVRQRKNTFFGSPTETVNRTKQKKLRLTAEYYCLCKNIPTRMEQRFDVVGIVAENQGNSIEWVTNAF